MTTQITRFVPILAIALVLSTGGAQAQTATTTDTTVPATTPAAPNTGLGGEVAQNLFALAVTAGIVVAGTTYLARTRPS
jgi:hypothetical protein